jgi:hypothetical protein
MFSRSEYRYSILKSFSYTNLTRQDETWAEFSTLNVIEFCLYLKIAHITKTDKLKVENSAQKLVGSLPLAAVLVIYKHSVFVEQV